MRRHRSTCGEPNLQKRSLRQTIALEIRDAMTQVEMNEARLEASRTAVRAAEERLQAEEARFEVGLGTTRQLIEAQRDLLQSISVEVRSEMDLRKSLALLDNVCRAHLRKETTLSLPMPWRRT